MKNPWMLVLAGFCLALAGLLVLTICAIYQVEPQPGHAGHAIYRDERGVDQRDHAVQLELEGADAALGTTWVLGSLPDARIGDEVKVWVDPANQSDPASLGNGVFDPLTKLAFTVVLGLTAMLLMAVAVYSCRLAYKQERRQIRSGPQDSDGAATRDW